MADPRGVPPWKRLPARALALGAAASGRALERLGDLQRTANFLRGRLEFQSRDDDIYIVTYPRSGTTWMQYMLHLLTSDGTTDFAHIGQVCPWFERSLSIGFQTAADFETYASPRVFKSHLTYEWIPPRGRLLYIWRDGRDVAVSYYHLYRTHLRFQGDFAAFFDKFLRGDLQYGSWFDHVTNWLAHADDPRVLVLRFEDLMADRAGSMAKVLDHCGLQVSPDRLAETLARTDFSEMKKIESKFDHITSLLIERGLHPNSFLRSGKSGAGQTELQPDQTARFDQAVNASGLHRTPRGRPAPLWKLPAFLH